jgi:hypothetical protein
LEENLEVDGVEKVTETRDMLRHVASNWNTKRLAASPMNASLKESDFGFLVVDSITETSATPDRPRLEENLEVDGVEKVTETRDTHSEWIIVLPEQIDYGASAQGERQEI